MSKRIVVLILFFIIQFSNIAVAKNSIMYFIGNKSCTDCYLRSLISYSSSFENNSDVEEIYLCDTKDTILANNIRNRIPKNSHLIISDEAKKYFNLYNVINKFGITILVKSDKSILRIDNLRNNKISKIESINQFLNNNELHIKSKSDAYIGFIKSMAYWKNSACMINNSGNIYTVKDDSIITDLTGILQGDSIKYFYLKNYNQQIDKVNSSIEKNLLSLITPEKMLSYNEDKMEIICSILYEFKIDTIENDAGSRTLIMKPNTKPIILKYDLQTKAITLIETDYSYYYNKQMSVIYTQGKVVFNKYYKENKYIGDDNYENDVIAYIFKDNEAVDSIGLYDISQNILNDTVYAGNFIVECHNDVQLIYNLMNKVFIIKNNDKYININISGILNINFLDEKSKKDIFNTTEYKYKKIFGVSPYVTDDAVYIGFIGKEKQKDDVFISKYNLEGEFISQMKVENDENTSIDYFHIFDIKNDILKYYIVDQDGKTIFYNIKCTE